MLLNPVQARSFESAVVNAFSFSPLMASEVVRADLWDMSSPYEVSKSLNLYRALTR